jgi:hypothetical protein
MGMTSNSRVTGHGVIFGALGYIGSVALAMTSLRSVEDPQTVGMFILVAVGPVGAALGAWLGVSIGRRRAASIAAEEASAAAPVDSTALNTVKSLATLAGIAAALIGGYLLFAYLTATPWLRPGNQYLLFEVRLPAGAAMPNPRDGVKVTLVQIVSTLLESNINTMPADMERATFRQEGDRVVIVGEIALAYRSSDRQVEVTIPRRQMQTYPLKLASSPRHMKQFSDWQKIPDGSEIRYRVKWPGED